MASTQADSQGRIGHYEVMGVLGTGGFGVVLRAFDTVLNRVVAVKLLAPQLAVSVSSRQRFLREARSSAAIRHKNVVQVYAVVEQPLPYLVMEFLPGETLQQRMDRVGPLPVTDVIEIGRQVAEGLAAAHATGLIHRDVKPANVFLEQIEGLPNALSVKLLDFGLARAVDDVSITQNGMIIGTPLYMSPEQARGVPLDRRADLFSLGSVLYAMTTGHSPFRAEHTLATLKRVTEDTPQPIHELAPETPHWLCDLTTQLLAKDPAERIQSAREVVDRLGRADRGVAPDERSGTAASRYRPRRLGTVIGAAVAGVVLLAAIMFSLPTRNGTVRIEIEGLSTEEQRQIQVEVFGHGDSRVVDAAHGWEIAVKEGEYTARVSGGSDRVEIVDNK